MSTFAFEPSESEFDEVEDELSLDTDEWIARMLA